MGRFGEAKGSLPNLGANTTAELRLLSPKRHVPNRNVMHNYHTELPVFPISLVNPLKLHNKQPHFGFAS